VTCQFLTSTVASPDSAESAAPTMRVPEASRCGSHPVLPSTLSGWPPLLPMTGRRCAPTASGAPMHPSITGCRRLSPRALLPSAGGSPATLPQAGILGSVQARPAEQEFAGRTRAGRAGHSFVRRLGA
jgi:hypothetical protein